MKYSSAYLNKKWPIFFKKTCPFFDLIIYDDTYPHPLSGFRTEEFTCLLTKIERSKILLSADAYKAFKLPLEQHAEHIECIERMHPAIHGKMRRVKYPFININCKVFYCVFLNNIFKNIDWIEQNNIPFVFTLYPGGGLILDDKESDRKLEKVLSSPCFRKVIVTQKHTYNYLINKNFCTENSIQFVFGVVVPQESLKLVNTQKKYFSQTKTTLDICFCATKYSKLGEDKGYPLFVEFSKAIAAKYEFVRFHVIGGYNKDVIDISAIENKITFHGYLPFDDLKKVFEKNDIIFSPNQPGKLSKGSFDGFPLGTVIEAALNEVMVMLTDCLNENRYFKDGEELIIIQPDVNDMIAKFELLIKDIDSIYRIAKAGKKRFAEIYSNTYQMNPRYSLLESVIREK